MKKIRLVLFDIGGVLVKWQDTWLYEKISKKYGIPLNILESECKNTISKLHSGEISENEFWKIIGMKFNCDELINCERSFFFPIFSKLAKIDTEVLTILNQIKNIGLMIGTLSNLESTTKKILNNQNFFSNFDFEFLSHEIGFTKPDKRIFQYVLIHNPYNADEIIFIDDKLDNIMASNNIGIRSILYTNPKNLIHELKNLEIL